jgi:hypothetical protein
MKKSLIVRGLLAILFVLISAAALSRGHAVDDEFQMFRGVIYGFIALALMLSLVRR